MWKLADAWGGSTKGEIVQGLNTALAGERYSQEAFGSTPRNLGCATLLQEMIGKQRHIKNWKRV